MIVNFIICFFGGYIGYDNRPCNSLEYAMGFTTLEEAEKEKEKLQQGCTFELSVRNIRDCERLEVIR